MAVIVTPAPTVPDLVAECAAKGVKGIVVITAGFRETGPEGEALERRILAQAREARIRIIGPNCLGIMNPVSGLNATFAAGMAAPGSVGFVSQSGALLTAVLDWSAKEASASARSFRWARCSTSAGAMSSITWATIRTPKAS
jgi:acetyltransferase